ncbi:hypothetical protein CVT26_006562 [Gymnopilus dilepis]|uniref:Uncharacterized protein n=1 Tax=Gymnopilus dilepis TaxID=231916 RepID=A0A409W609_9AGAR|nr:hypothetical protein CVT26_006562 [Gymnopilus dilepis]
MAYAEVAERVHNVAGGEHGAAGGEHGTAGGEHDAAGLAGLTEDGEVTYGSVSRARRQSHVVSAGFNQSDDAPKAPENA